MKLVKGNHPALSTVSTEVDMTLPVQVEEVEALGQEMWNTMVVHGGIGLAANQVGVTDRVIAVRFRPYKFVIVNPVITSTRGKLRPSWEMCLSFPGQKVKRMRYHTITVEGLTTDGTTTKYKLKGMPAYVVQHEIDHLNGITIDEN